MRLLLWPALLVPALLSAQVNINLAVDASTVTGTINPLWGDHYELHLLSGAGGNPTVDGPKAPFIDDPGFLPEMARLRPRSIRISTGRYDDPGTADDYSTDTTVLRNLPTEFYRGPNTLAGADDPSNYDFSYVDSLVDVVHAMGADPYVEMAAMPFRLSAVDTPTYFPCVYWTPPCHLFSWDNAIRTAPPADPAVYGRVFYHLVKHLYETRGVHWFEVWNEPDQFPGLTPFWDGDAPQLHAMLAALTAEVNADPALSPHVEIGCCSFAMQSFLNLFAIQFLSLVQQHNTRLDFLSVHPYSSEPMGGYDSARTTVAEGWRDTYAPNAALLNTEWGVLNPGFGSAGWNSLDYGLDRLRALIEMQDRDYLFAHAASLADNDTMGPTCCLGMFYTKPTFAPKPAAFAYMAMNRLNDTPDRLSCTVNAPHLALAARSVTGDTVLVALPAPDPAPGTGTVSLTVNNLPWTTGTARRLELTMTGYAMDSVLRTASTSLIINGTFTDPLTYASDAGNGRLLLWELVRNTGVGIASDTHDERALVLMSHGGTLHVALADGRIPVRSRVINLAGASVATAVQGGVIDLLGISTGVYIIEAATADGMVFRERWVKP
ncbi:MAG: hypothetical protein IT228_10225 [Flavobacteriales bacterium]|nr:hypothetical protein [Flavobacteriales bacterium]MCC6577705.1 hypothetical protein [Flavobacteriales bacterium]NUQ14466.1 hypothetical protein [Flavobacteriales bacterium]